jgi:hypothetical protein
MTLFQDIYKNYGDLEATYESLKNMEELPLGDDSYNYTRDELMERGGEQQEAIDRHNELLDSKPSSFMRTVVGGWRHNTLTGTAVQSAIDSFKMDRFDIDQDFDVNEAYKSVEQEFQTEPERESLMKANNQGHFDVLASNLRDYQEYKLDMERLGVPLSFASQLFAEVGNVGVNFIPFLSIGTKAKYLLKTKDVLRGAALQGTANVAEEALINEVYNDRTISDYVATYAMGAGFAGTFIGGAKLWNQTKFEAGVRVKEEADAFAKHVMKEKADESLATAKNGPKPERDWVDSSHLRDAEGNLKPVIKHAMEKKGYNPDSEFDIWLQRYESEGLVPRVQKVAQEKLNLQGFAQTLHGSENPAFRALGRAFFEHGEGGTGVHKELSSALEATVETNRLFSNYNKSYLEHKAVFAKEAEAHGIPMKEFDRIAYRYIDGEGAIGYDGTLRRPGDSRLNDILEDFRLTYENQNKKLVQHLREAGVAEADQFGESAHLFRRYDGEQFLKLTQEIGSAKPIKKLLQESITKSGGFKDYSQRYLKRIDDEYKKKLKAHEDALKKLEGTKTSIESQIKGAADPTVKMQAQARLENVLKRIEERQAKAPEEPKVGTIDVDGVIKRAAEAVYNRMLRRGYEHQADANLLSANNQSLLIQSMEDLIAEGGMTKADLDHVKGVLDTAGRDLKSDPTKRRLTMDMNVSIAVDGREIKMTDLLDVDLGAGYLSTGRYWVGRAALARKGEHFASEEAIEKSISRAAELGAKKYKMKGKDVQKQADLIRKGVELIKGRPVEDMSATSSVIMRNIRKAVQNATLGKLGIVQASETGRMIAAVNASMRIPMVKELVNSIATGKMDAGNMKEIQDYLVGNIGYRRFMNHPDFRADDFGHRVHPIEKFQDKMGYYLSMASGWNRVHVAQTRVLMNGLTQKWYREVMDGTFKETQMRDLGVDDLLLKDLKTEMQKHARKIEGLDGQKSYVELGVENWEPATRRKFAMMLHRKASNAIQMIEVGETPMWLNTAMGKFLGQFRTFSIGALSKQTTRDYKMLREGDTEGAVAMAFNVATSTMANAVKIGFAAATMQGERRDEYLERALNPVNLANQTLSYVSQLSPLMDAGNIVADTLVGGGFMGGRYGITSAAPGLSYINKGYTGISGTFSAMLTDEEMTAADYRGVFGMIPFANNYAFEALNNALVIPGAFGED